ncbi:glycosyltransferase [Flavobacterium sp. JAS]|uniref:glycosyltransferase family 2 protein n=1 Tax=Flavobacterium sp. JAS TaxID=2897329 RepID=UPI001E3AA7A8|nr:glycosyltransferase [Flavobacterium sp. JAS]MCD0471083.1 glycosyltransferase [Flavobacterium sp. JAS]
MKDNYLVSIIMPAFNAGSYIETSIKSVLEQTYQNWELIIIDDGSLDDTGIICKGYAAKDKRIIYIYQDNAKQAIARNNGIKNARGEILAFLDSDDLWLSNKLELSLLHFDLENFDLIFTDAYFSNKDQLDIFDPKMEKMGIPKKTYFGNTGIANFIEVNQIPILTVLVKKAAVEQINFFDENCVPAEDYDLWLRLLKNKYRFRSLDLPLSVYRVHSASSSSSDRFVTDMVLKSIMKNFNADDIQEMNAMPFVKNWILRWIKLYLTKSNCSQLKILLDHFEYKKMTVKLSFLLGNFISFTSFKYLISKTI